MIRPKTGQFKSQQLHSSVSFQPKLQGWLKPGGSEGEQFDGEQIRLVLLPVLWAVSSWPKMMVQTAGCSLSQFGVA